jgi:hypothetical protein
MSCRSMRMYFGASIATRTSVRPMSITVMVAVPPSLMTRKLSPTERLITKGI